MYTDLQLYPQNIFNENKARYRTSMILFLYEQTDALNVFVNKSLKERSANFYQWYLFNFPFFCNFKVITLSLQYF